MKIYTKTGDRGDTSLISGRRVSKADIQIEAYGTIDELIAFVGYLRDEINDQHTIANLIKIQDKLMVIAAILSNDEKKPNVVALPKISDDDILSLEKEIDAIENTIPPLTAFILPGGHPIVSLCHIVRTICRRAERTVIAMASNLHVDEGVIRYLNRLSDYFFVLARKMAKDLKVNEIEWHPDL